VRVLAVKFADRQKASTALRRIRQRIDLAPRDAAIAPLGELGGDGNGETLLAGRFADEEVTEVRRLLHDEGGEIMANVDERWTQPWRPATEGESCRGAPSGRRGKREAWTPANGSSRAS
jgi:hypothetical protein